AELRITLTHLPKTGPINAPGCNFSIPIDPDWNFSHCKIENDLIQRGFIRRLRRMEVKRCAERRMTGERKFLCNRKDADFFSVLLFDRCVPRKNESRFGEIHLLRQGLHFSVAQPSCINKDGQRIALQTRPGEDVDLNEIVSALHFPAEGGSKGFCLPSCSHDRAL